MKNDSTQSVQISGSAHPEKYVAFQVLLLAFFMTPLLAIGGCLINLAIQIGAKHFLSILFGSFAALAGAFFIGSWFYLIWYFAAWLPGITVSRFALIDQDLELHTPRLQRLKISIQDVLECRIIRRRSVYYWIRLRNHGWLYLRKQTSNADKLAAYLKQIVKHR